MSIHRNLDALIGAEVSKLEGGPIPGKSQIVSLEIDPPPVEAIEEFKKLYPTAELLGLKKTEFGWKATRIKGKTMKAYLKEILAGAIFWALVAIILIWRQYYGE